MVLVLVTFSPDLMNRRVYVFFGSFLYINCINLYKIQIKTKVCVIKE